MKSIFKVAGSGFLLITSTGLQADIIHNDDVLTMFSHCIGNDCVNGESFGFDTVRLKENNLRIHFQDTSASASFPTNDWRIIINDSANGGANYFGVEDSSAGRIPFRIEAGAPANSLYVESDGDVGIGTSNPVVDIHDVNGNTPTLRLEQNGSSGFTPQTWDMAGNEANFFIRDVTNGSTLPFRIKPGAPSNAIFVEAGGDVGFGTDSPTAQLHVRDTNGETALLVEEASSTQLARNLLILENNGNPEMRMTNSANGNSWLVSAGLRYVIKNNAGDWVSRITSTGDMEITGSLTTAGGTCGGGCDLTFHPDTTIESIEEHASSMWTNSYLPAVGPTIENAPFNITQKTGGMLNELEKAHIYIEQLHNRLAVLEAEQAELKQAVMLLIRKDENGVLLTSN